jgi:hypothetical protein
LKREAAPAQSASAVHPAPQYSAIWTWGWVRCSAWMAALRSREWGKWEGRGERAARWVVGSGRRRRRREGGAGRGGAGGAPEDALAAAAAVGKRVEEAHDILQAKV